MIVHALTGSETRYLQECLADVVADQQPLLVAWDGGLKVKDGTWTPPLGHPAPEYPAGPLEPSQARVQAQVNAIAADEGLDTNQYQDALRSALSAALDLLAEYGVEVAR